MDSERRHELETNDLREFFDNFKDFWDKHGNRLLIALIVVLGGWLGYSKYYQWQAEKAEAAYTELNDADSADALRAVAAEHTRVYDEATRRSGDIALGDAREALIVDDGDSAKAALDKAFAAYTALASRGTTVEYQLIGNEGLAKVALMREAWDKAAEHYQKVIALAGETFLTQADRAKRAMDRIDLLKNPVAFAPEIAVEPTPQPQQDEPAIGGELPVFPNFPSPGDQLVPSDDLPSLPLPAAE